MPGLEGDLEEWQTQEVNVTRGEAEGDIDLEGLPFLKVNRGPRHYLFCYSRQFYIFMHINIHFFYPNNCSNKFYDKFSIFTCTFVLTQSLS